MSRPTCLSLQVAQYVSWLQTACQQLAFPTALVLPHLPGRVISPVGQIWTPVAKSLKAPTPLSSAVNHVSLVIISVFQSKALTHRALGCDLYSHNSSVLWSYRVTQLPRVCFLIQTVTLRLWGAA